MYIYCEYWTDVPSKFNWAIWDPSNCMYTRNKWRSHYISFENNNGWNCMHISLSFKNSEKSLCGRSACIFFIFANNFTWCICRWCRQLCSRDGRRTSISRDGTRTSIPVKITFSRGWNTLNSSKLLNNSFGSKQPATLSC